MRGRAAKVGRGGDDGHFLVEPDRLVEAPSRT
jgi:hypothetical protein